MAWWSEPWASTYHLPQHGNLSDRDKVLEGGRLMQAELVRLGLSEDELSADFKAWQKGHREPPTA